MGEPRVLAFAGTTRTDALNKKLIRVAADAARRAGAEVTLIDLRDLPMPLYDGDLEAKEGLPANAKAFKALLASHAGLLISTGEYNASVTGVLKNAIDWASRSDKGEGPLASFKDKVAGLVSASPGVLGGLRAIGHVRAILDALGVMTIQGQFALSRASDAFNLDGSLKDPKQLASVEKVASSLVLWLRRAQS